MKVIAINGSPRKDYNTAELLRSFLDGASHATDVETKLVHLYDLNFKGCTECYACKLKDGASYGKCAYPDDIRELLQEVSHADVVVFGSPVFFFDISGELRCFLERLFYPYTAFKRGSKPIIAPRNIRTAYIYTMNVTEPQMRRSGYTQNLQATLYWTQAVFGHKPETLYACNTYQYRDYSKYVADAWDIENKKKWHEEHFPIDKQNAFELGQKLVRLSKQEGE